MPKKSHKRKRSKRYRRHNKLSLSRLPLNGFPTTKAVRLRYSQEVLINSEGGALTGQNFGANCLFDPYLAIGGHQPRGFDQWMAQYNYAYVVGSKITAQPLNHSASNKIPGAYGILLIDNTADLVNYTTLESVVESRHAGSSQRNYRVGGMIYQDNRKDNIVSRTYSAKAQHGRNIVGNEVYANTVNNNPTQQSVFVLWQAPIANNDPAQQNYLVTIDYLCIFKEPNFLVQS